MPPHSETMFGCASMIDSWMGNKRRLLCGNMQAEAPGILEVTETEKPKKVKKHKEQRFVSFNEDVETIEVQNMRDLPREQINDMYLSKGEMSTIHAECWEIVELMNLGIEYDEQNTFSKRGLVDLKDVDVERRRRLREQAYKVVFGVQAFQMKGKEKGVKGCMDTTQIMAELYTQVSAKAQKDAYSVAQNDALDASKAWSPMQTAVSR